MPNRTRRQILKASAAAATVAAGSAVASRGPTKPAMALPAVATSNDPDPLPALMRELQQLDREQERLVGLGHAADARMPQYLADLRPPKTDFGSLRGCYLAEDVQAYRDRESASLSDDGSRRAFVQECNRLIRERRRFEAKRRKAADMVGVTALDDRLEVVTDRIIEVEDRIFRTPATTLEGIVAKLKVTWKYMMPPPGEEPDYEALSVKSALEDAERLARKMSATS